MSRGSTAEILRFVITFLLIGITLMLILQNMSGGVKEKSEVRNTTESADKIGLWSYCVSSGYGASLTNRYLKINYKLGGGICVAFDGGLQDDKGNHVVQDYKILIAARALGVIALILVIIGSLLIEIGDNNRCIMTATMIILIIGFLVEVVVMSLMIAYWQKRKDTFAIAWPWIMAFVAVGLLVILLVILGLMCKRSTKGGNKKQDEGDSNKKGNLLRWLLILLFLPTLAFQFVIHADHGSIDHKKQGEYNSRMGLWRFCLDRKTQISWGRGATLRNMYSDDMCIILDGSVPTKIVNYTLVVVALICCFIAHSCTLSAFLLALFPKHVQSLKTRKCLFIMRFVMVIIMVVSFTITCACATASVPDDWKMGFGFICAWVAWACMLAILLIVAIQCTCKKNLLGEAPELEKEDDDRQQERRKLSPQPKREEKEETEDKKKTAFGTREEKPEDENRKSTLKPPPYVEKDPQYGRESRGTEEQPEAAPATEPEDDPRIAERHTPWRK